MKSDGVHGLSCRLSAGRFGRHVEYNMILKLALTSAQIPSILEPSGLNSFNRDRPDGITLSPWSNGRFLTWDATRIDTLGPSYINISRCWRKVIRKSCVAEKSHCISISALKYRTSEL